MDRAITDAARAIELDPKSVLNWNARGVARFRARDFAGAVADFTRAGELDPSEEAIQRNLARAKDELAKQR